jgi:hypothetical protein
MKYANRLGIPYVIFDADLQIKDMQTGEQQPIDPASWEPPRK